MSQDLGEVLLSQGSLNETQLREAVALQRTGGLRLGEALLKLGLVDESNLARALAKSEGLPFVDLTKGSPSRALHTWLRDGSHHPSHHPLEP